MLTAIIWNEIGRGTDLVELEEWFLQNPEIVQELTTAVMQSEAPRITDFIEINKEHLEAAKRGEKLFLNSCAKCHGNYEKVWNQAGAEKLSLKDQFKTFKVHYHEQTPVRNVGTDEKRVQAFGAIEPMNKLHILKTFGIELKEQKGYIPPPLVGIWARWPYLHNNSIPSLCALMTPEDQRPKKYYAGMPLDPERDFDFDCNGYPTGDAVPKEWKKNRRATYRVKKNGLSNRGHSKGIFVRNGKEVFTPDQKQDLIRFLQSL